MTARIQTTVNTGPSEQTTYILITGANTGLGLASSKRLLDEFIQSRPSNQLIHLIITTRHPNKSFDTIRTLQKYVSRKPSLKASVDRIWLSSHEVDLTNLKSVLGLAETLNTTYPHLNSLICNAGLMGAEGINWIPTIWALITDMRQSLTWPQNVRYNLRSLVKPQLDGNAEPPLGSIFTANVFGHYILAAHLMPLLSKIPEQAGPGRIIWISSIETVAATFRIDDIQCLDRREAYSSSKRLTDLLVLNYDQPLSQKSVNSFTSLRTSGRQRVEMFLAHPGVTATSIVPLPLPMLYAKYASFYLIRLLGSPWHFISTYKGAVSAVWLALAPYTTISQMEERDGKAKWGSATDPLGDERVARTEVEGWGYGGIVGRERMFGRNGRRRGAVDLNEDYKEAFLELGAKCWEALEKMRMEWEERLKQAE